MKKIVLMSVVLWMSATSMAQQVSERYLKEIDNISTQYNTDMKYFLRTLDSHTTSFNPQQKAQFCGIVSRYVNAFYQATDKNRSSLPVSYAQMSKQDVIDKVMQSKEMRLISKYNIQCDLNGSL